MEWWHVTGGKGSCHRAHRQQSSSRAEVEMATARDTAHTARHDRRRDDMQLVPWQAAARNTAEQMGSRAHVMTKTTPHDAITLQTGRSLSQYIVSGVHMMALAHQDRRRPTSVTTRGTQPTTGKKLQRRRRRVIYILGIRNQHSTLNC